MGLIDLKNFTFGDAEKLTKKKPLSFWRATYPEKRILKIPQPAEHLVTSKLKQKMYNS